MIYVRVVKSFDNMFSPVQIKQEYPGVDDGNQNITNGVPAASDYPIFTNQDVEYMYRQLPQFWGQAQLQTNQIVEDLASKGEPHVRQDIAHNQPPIQHVTVANYLQQQSQSQHVMPFQVEQQHPHEQDSQQPGGLSQQQQQQPQQQQQQQQQQVQQSQQPSLPHTSQDSHPSQLMMQHPGSLNPALLAVQTQVTTVPTTKHNGPGRPPKSTTGGNSQSSPPKKMKCQCEICFKEFGHKSNLFIHMRTHNGERPYKCTQCDKCFTHSGNLAIHMRTHSGERPYACQICGKMFSHSGNLSTHLRTHSGVKPYKCPVCGKEFRHSGNLSIHERIHSGIKPFQCKVCGKEFYHSGNLTTHMKKHPIGKNPIEQQQQQQQHCTEEITDRNDPRIDPMDVSSNNPVRLAVNVASSTNRGITMRNNVDRDSVKSEGHEDKRGDESLQFAPPTS